MSLADIIFFMIPIPTIFLALFSLVFLFSRSRLPFIDIITDLTVKEVIYFPPYLFTCPPGS